MAIPIARRLLIPCTSASMACPATVVSAQPAPYRVQQLAEGVYAMLREYKPHGAADSNVLIIITDADVVVVDANIYPSSTRQTIDEIRKLTPKPVRYVINTHWHGDHHFGNRVYQEAFPGVEIVAHPLTRELVITRELPSLEKNLTTECPATLTRIDATKIVPGHGPVQTDWSYVNRLIPLFETTWEQVRKAVASGADLEATRKAVNVDSHRDAFGGSTPEARRSFDALFLNPAIESAFKELRPDSTSRN